MRFSNLFLIASVFFIVFKSSGQTLTLQPDGISGKDALVQISDNLANDGNTNFGNSDALKSSRTSVSSLWYKTRGLLQFDLSSVPKNAVITSATLTLSGTNHSTAGQSNISTLSRLAGNWEEQTVTWNNQPSGTASTVIAVAASTSSTQVYNIDVKAHVQDMVKNPAANFGWMLKLNGEASSLTSELFFASSDYTTDITKRPKLVVTYLVLNMLQTAAATPLSANGAIDLTVSGGISPYTYAWVNAAGSGIATTQDVTGLSPGYYAVTVTDNAGKVASAYAIVGSKGIPVTVAVQPNPALGIDATITTYDNGTTLTGNYETAATMIAKRWTNSGQWFRQKNLIAYDLSSIPPYAIITDAKLYLYGTDHLQTGQANTSVLQRVTSPWTESYVTGYIAPASSSTGEIPILASTSATQNYVINVTSNVQDMVHAPETNYGWLLKLTGEGINSYTQLIFASSDYTTDVTKRPKLEISFYIPANEETRNWVNVESFDDNGNVMGQTRSYTDGLGRTIQQQDLDIENSNVLAAQNVFDAFGRPVLQTLAAPLFQGGIYYKDGFIKDGAGNNYSYDDFDKPVTTSNLSGEINNPASVSSSGQGSLGWYYSNNNTDETYVPASSFPYTRTEFYNDPLGRVKRSSAVGENHKMGSGNENELFYMANAGELSYVYGFNSSAVTGNKNLQPRKTISVDADGKILIQYSTNSGLQIATCRSGVTNTCVSQKVSQSMPYFGLRGVSIHIPASKKNKLKLTIPGNAGWYGINENVSTNPQQIIYKIYDLRKGKFLVENTDYTFNRTTRAVSFINTYLAGDGFFRISFEYTSTYLSERFDPLYATSLQKFSPDFIPGLSVQYELDYSDWAINFFDAEGRLVKSVQPEAINCTYNPVSYNTVTGGSSTKNYAVATSNTYTYEVETTPVTNFDQTTTFYMLRLFNNCHNGVSSYNRSFTPAPVDIDLELLSVDEGPLDSLFSETGVTDDIQTNRAPIRFGTGEGEVNPTEPLDPPLPYPGIDDPAGLWGQTRYYLNLEYSVLGTVAGSNVTISSGNKFVSGPEGNIPEVSITQETKVGSTVYEKLGISFTAVNVDVYDFDSITESYYYVRTDVINSSNPAHANLLCNYQVTLVSNIYKYPTPMNLVEVSEPLVTTVNYNKLDWPVKTVSGDEGTVNVIYDSEGKVRFTQNYEQLLNGGKFSYIAYDRAGRAVETGEYDPAISASGSVLAFLPYNADGSVPTYSGSGTSVHTIIDNIGWAHSNRSTQQTYNAYDVAQTDFPGTLTGYSQNYKDGKLSKTWNSNGTQWYGYDDLNRSTWLVNSITGLGVKSINYTYTKNGQVDKIDYQKEVSAERFLHQYTYDADQRLKETKTSLDNITFNSNQLLKYYLHGALKRKELGGTLQGLDYVYTINGWLKSMNDPTLSDRDPGKDSYTGVNSAFKKDIFGLTLDYFTGDYSRTGTNIQTYTPAGGSSNTLLPESYSGTIRAARWQTTVPVGTPTLALTGEVQYAYKYDNKNQLTEAIFGQIQTGGATPTNGLSTTTGAEAIFSEQANAYRVNNITYDKNGNLKTLKRQGTPSALSMDDFTYNYDASKHNRLTSITDVAGNHSYLDDINSQSANNYLYNNLGQLTKDVSEDYNYTYDLNGKVLAIKRTSGVNVISIDYNASGQRQKKTTYDGFGVATGYTWYVYDVAGTLLSTYTTVVSTSVTSQADLQIYGAGRVGVYQRTTSYNVINYVYEITDHLGNVRSTFRNNTGNAEVLSFADYYPHGSTMPNRNYVSGNAYKFAYQGQEKDNETGFLNFDLRQYDPRIGRWFNPDPMKQHFSPYLAMGNNPVSSVDPTGGEDGDIQGGTLKTVTITPYNRDPYGLFDTKQGHVYSTRVAYDPAHYRDSWDGPNAETAEQIAHQAKMRSEVMAASKEQAMEIRKGYEDLLKAQGGGGRNYGGDGSGSFMDNAYYVADQINQFNPIANAWDAVTGYMYGTDRLGNSQSTLQTTLKAASIIPIGKIGSMGASAIEGVTAHGVNQAITRGFSSQSILQITRQGSATSAMGRYGLQTRYMLGGNTVVVNSQGKVITVFSTAENGMFIPFGQ